MGATSHLCGALTPISSTAGREPAPGDRLGQTALASGASDGSCISVPASVDLDRLLRFRLAVGRFGEMDAARWWNTTGLLGPRGVTVLSRGLPATHYFAQARVVFAVAHARCEEVFSPPSGAITLWDLPAELEQQFEEHWQTWLGEVDDWRSFFESLAGLGEADLSATLGHAAFILPEQMEAAERLRRSADDRAVLVPAGREVDDDLISLLALGFSKGAPGQLAVPYASLANST